MNKKVLFSSILHFENIKKIKTDSHNILIIYNGGIGDSVLFLSTLSYLVSRFNVLDQKVFITGKGFVLDFIKCAEIVGLNYIPLDESKYLNKYSYFKSKNRELSSFSFIKVFSFHDSRFSALISRNISCKNKYGMVLKYLSKKDHILGFLDFIGYTKKISPQNELGFYFSFQEDMVKAIFIDSEFKASIFGIPEHTSTVHNQFGNYCTICPTTNEFSKGWEEEKFVEIINFILINSNLNIVISAGKEGIGFIRRFLPKILFPKRIIDMAGKLNYIDWIETIRNSCFCVGNDSSAAHIAASTNVKYIAITSGFCYGTDMPYPGNDSRNPICVYTKEKMNCFDCYYRYGKRGGKNNKCLESIHKGGKYLCIKTINVEQVISELPIKQKEGIL